MADFADLETALPSLFAAMLGCPCDFAKQPRALHLTARAELDILAERGVGWDEQRAHAVPTYLTTEDGTILTTEDGTILVTEQTLTQQTTVTGQREMTISCTVWTPSQSLGLSARAYLERLRLRLMFPSNVEALRVLGLGLIETSTIALIDPPEEDRSVSQATLDVRFSHAQSEADKPTEVIARARVKAQSITRPDGTPTNVQPDRVIPE